MSMSLVGDVGADCDVLARRALLTDTRPRCCWRTMPLRVRCCMHRSQLLPADESARENRPKRDTTWPGDEANNLDDKLSVNVVRGSRITQLPVRRSRLLRAARRRGR